MHLVLKLIAAKEEEESDKNGSKTEKRNRNEENRRQIVDFIADNVAILNGIINNGNLYALHPKQKCGLLSVVLLG
jgi:hypothetical protein